MRRLLCWLGMHDMFFSVVKEESTNKLIIEEGICQRKDCDYKRKSSYGRPTQRPLDSGDKEILDHIKHYG